MWIESRPIEPNLAPADCEALFQCRVFGPGRVDYLKNRFDAGLRPLPTFWQGYAPPTVERGEDVIEGPFDAGLIVLRQIPGRRFSLESGGMIAAAMRNTLMSRCGDAPPEWISGHAADGSPSTRLRPAYLPLGFVGREHADGHLLGVAIAIPRGFAEDEIDLLYDLLARHDGDNPHDIEAGIPYLSLAVCTPALKRSVGKLELVIDETSERNPKRNLRPSAWTGPAYRWATVTPVLLPRFPRRDLTPEEVIATACANAGFPTPVAVRADFAPYIQGVPHSRSFRIHPRNGRPLKPWLHAEIQFEQAVRGPVLLGAGRYAGLGVFRPLAGEEKLCAS
jgi:CRISPR-associated protein Csb2